jgi:hypothetical protein
MFQIFKQEKTPLLVILVAVLMLLWGAPVIFLQWQEQSVGRVAGIFSTQNITQYYPYAEFQIPNVQYTGNPYDLVATATFTRQGGGETRTVDMYYDGDTATAVGTWKFRFNGDLTGTWDITTSSTSNADVNDTLHAWTGQVNVSANSNNVLKRGRAKANSSNPNKWTKEGLDSENLALNPKFVMADDPAAYYFTPGKLQGDLNLYIYDQNQVAETQSNYGFDGFHVPVYCRWFDLNTVRGRCSSTNPNAYNNNNTKNPDRRTFAALEQIITETYKRGGGVHIWLWSKNDNANSNQGSYGGANGTAAMRLYRYIAARMCALPGWSMGFEDEEIDALVEQWYDYMNGPSGKCAWPHLLTAAGKANTNNSAQLDGNLNNNTDRLTAFNSSSPYGLIADNLNTYSWSNEQASYNLLLNTIGATPVSSAKRPHFAEERVVVGNTDDLSYSADKDSYTYLMATRNMVYSLMVGGIAGIYGNIGPTPGDTTILDGDSNSKAFDVTNYYAGTVPNGVDVARQHWDGITATPYNAKQHFLNTSIVGNRYLKADMVPCTTKVIRDSEDGTSGFSLNDGSGVCLESPLTGDELLIVYEENVGPAGTSTDIQLDLSSYAIVNEVRAINLRAASYAETNVVGISNGASEAWSPGTLSDWILIINVDDGAAPPDAIADLTATAGDENVILNWTEPANNGDLISDYKVYFKPISSGSWSAAELTNSRSNTYEVVGGLVIGITYQFKVAAVNNEGDAPDSNIAQATIIGVPDGVVDLSGTQNNAVVNLTWTAPSSNGGGITDYVVEYKLSSASEYTIFIDGNTSTTGASVTGLTGGQTYDFRVAAINAAGQGAYSNVFQITLTQLTPPSGDLYRFFNTITGTHFYTKSTKERDKVIATMAWYAYEGANSKVFLNNDVVNPEVTAVFRFFNTNTGTHFYTNSVNERNKLINTMPWFSYEGTNFYVYIKTSLSGTPVYRFYNTATGTHFYTQKESEKNKLLTNPAFSSYQFEGVIYRAPTS